MFGYFKRPYSVEKESENLIKFVVPIIIFWKSWIVSNYFRCANFKS